MRKLRLGQVDYINCLPVYQPVEEGIIPLAARVVKGPPTKLNGLFVRGELDITPISSIEYARHHRGGVILPDLSITADGDVMSILLFSKVPVTELGGRRVALPSSSASSVALLKILLEHYYQAETEFLTLPPKLDSMLKKAEAALLIGDDALLAHHQCRQEQSALHITDLGAAWKEFTGEKMVYALWVINRDFVNRRSADVRDVSAKLVAAKNHGLTDIAHIVKVAADKSGLPTELMTEYFRIMEYDLGPEQQKGLMTFYDYAYKSGLIDERVKPEIWSESGGNL